MALVVLPANLTAHSDAKAVDVMADLNAIIAQVNGNLEAANLKDKGISAAKYGDASIPGTAYGNLSIPTGAIADAAVTTGKLADAAGISRKIAPTVAQADSTANVRLLSGEVKDITGATVTLTGQTFFNYAIIDAEFDVAGYNPLSGEVLDFTFEGVLVQVIAGTPTAIDGRAKRNLQMRTQVGQVAEDTVTISKRWVVPFVGGTATTFKLQGYNAGSPPNLGCDVPAARITAITTAIPL